MRIAQLEGFHHLRKSKDRRQQGQFEQAKLLLLPSTGSLRSSGALLSAPCLPDLGSNKCIPMETCQPLILFSCTLLYCTSQILPYFAVYNAYPYFLCIIHGTIIPWPLLIIAMYNVHPYFSLKNLGKKVPIVHGKIWYVLLQTEGKKIMTCFLVYLPYCSGLDLNPRYLRGLSA